MLFRSDARLVERGTRTWAAMGIAGAMADEGRTMCALNSHVRRPIKHNAALLANRDGARRSQTRARRRICRSNRGRLRDRSAELRQRRASHNDWRVVCLSFLNAVSRNREKVRQAGRTPLA